MAEGPDPVTEIGLEEVEADEEFEVDEDDDGDFISSKSYTDDAPISDSEDINVSEVLEQHPEDSNVANENPSYLKRLSTGNATPSGCYSIIESITGGARYIEYKLIQAYYQDGSVVILPSSITESCQLILNAVRKYNGHDNILVQEKWLNETEYLLQNKVLTIGVFGRHKAGKSTLLNALLYHEVLSVADTNETAFILRIRHRPSNHRGSSCFQDTERFLSMKEEKIKGRRNIRKTIQKRNSDIRGKAATIDVDEVVAHVPFLCRCSTGDINVVLLDTPGLSESNELGISEVSEHQLMTCSAYVYVISSQQLEDSIDTDSLRAIVERDPNVFKEKRILIAVTRLDLYNTPPNDESDSDSDSEDESSPGNDEKEILKHIDSIKEVIQRQCKCLDMPIPDDCIVPLCATGALEARKEKLGGKRSKEMKKLMIELEVSTAEELEEVSQVPLLEKKLIEIASNSYYLWHYNIVRDCTRYLDQAMEKLDKTKEEFRKLEKMFNDKVKTKEDIMKEFKALVNNSKSRYAKKSRFCTKLEDAYDEDLETNYEKIDTISKSHLSIFEDFRSEIKKRKRITAEDFDLEARQLFKDENESLRSDLKDLPFRKMDSVVRKSTHELGAVKEQLKQQMASYCNATTSISDESHLPEDHIICESISESIIPVSSSPPLKLRDVLEQSKVHYSLWDKFFIFFTKYFVKSGDQKRHLRNPEIDAFLNELESSFVAGCHEFFQKIKPGIVVSYVKEHRKIAEKQITAVERHYFEQRREMDNEVRKWRKQAKFNKEMIQSQSDLCDNLEKQKVHLVFLAKYFGISLFTR